MFCNLERIGRIEIVGNRVQIPVFEFHVPQVIFNVYGLCADIHRHEAIRRCENALAPDNYTKIVNRTSQFVRSQEQCVRSKRNTVVTVSSLRIARTAREDEVSIVDEIMTEAVVMTVQHDPRVLGNNVDERCELSFIGG